MTNILKTFSYGVTDISLINNVTKSIPNCIDEYTVHTPTKVDARFIIEGQQFLVSKTKIIAKNFVLHVITLQIVKETQLFLFKAVRLIINVFKYYNFIHHTN